MGAYTDAMGAFDIRNFRPEFSFFNAQTEVKAVDAPRAVTAAGGTIGKREI